MEETSLRASQSCTALLVGHYSAPFVFPSLPWRTPTQRSNLHLNIPSCRKHGLDCPGWMECPLSFLFPFAIYQTVYMFK